MENCRLSPIKYLVDNHKLSRGLFYEALLRKFGNMDAIQLSEPPDLKAMAMKAGLPDVGYVGIDTFWTQKFHNL